MATQEQVRTILERRLQRDGERFVAYPSIDAVVKRLSGSGEKLYMGIDATSTHLHIGHTVGLLLLRDLQKAGHDITVLFGDFTSRIGDPTDKTATRSVQTEDEVEANLETYQSQVEKILEPGTFSVRRNSEWLASMTFSDVAQLAARVTVQQMLTRDMFQDRLAQEKPIAVSEFLYPLMQGYDSVAMEVDGEVGGNDQTFNMLVGRDLAKGILGTDKMVLPVRLLVDAATGRKISKTEGGLIALDDEPGTIFEKVSRSVPDDMVRTVFELATDEPLEDIERRWRQAEEDGGRRAYNLDLAQTLVRMYYDEETAKKARERYEQIASEGTTGELKEYEYDLPDASQSRFVADAFGVSKSEAKRLIEQGGITLNGERLGEPLSALSLKDGDIVQRGSHQPVRIRIK